MEQEYEREHGSSRTEVRADGSIAQFSDPVEGFEPDVPALAGEHGTTIVDDDETPEPDGAEDDEQEENA